MIGPFRAGRTVGATGVPGRPNVFYIGVNNGGVWKTDDYGRTWRSLFDEQPTGSIGAIAVAPSAPDTIYVGSGEGLQRPDLSTGDGIYKSTDGGQTWLHLGLRAGQQIGAIIVDPKDANRILVAVLGHPYGPNEERGVFRSTDGGATFEKVLYKDENTGAIALAFDPKNSKTIYADLWAARQGPWENGAWQGPGSGLYKSTDGGSTWKQLTKGLPTFEQGLGRIGFAIAPSDPKRMYANVDAPQLGGIYRSDDAGESWTRVNSEVRIWGRGSDFAEVKVDPRDKDIVYSCNTSTYRSTDAGVTYHAFKGAPGGDDYHTIWINPENPEIILLASDQGATLSVNGGQTWSSWYNQPTAQFYHVSTDNQYPYWVYGGQQESGSIGTASRGDNGAITFRDWRTVGAEEYGYIAPDPLNPNLIYGGKLSRFDKRTGQAQSVAPEAVRSGKYRFLRTAPIVFSPVDPHILYYAGNVLFKTINGGQSWQIISPDLTREKYDVPESIGIYRKPEMATMPRRGVIYTVAPSPKDVNLIWAGTDDGLVHVTRDGGRTWQNVTPPSLTSWSKISLIDAGHFDTLTAYAAVNRIRLDDMHPHIYRTHDGGRTWQEIVRGLPDDPINTVREDPQRKGLLFAGSERAVYVSFNDGDDWQPLRLNMGASSVRDLVIHDDDIVVGTHGRSFWILDDITPLRQATAQIAASDAYLFRPQLATRVRRNVNTDTPLPPEEPAGQNPPDGAIIDYYLKADATTPVTLEILDRAGKLVRHFSSADPPEPVPVNEKDMNVPTYWIRPPQPLLTTAGMQRFVWDLHYPPPRVDRYDYPISANYRDTPPTPQGPLVLPGQYTVKLTVNGRSYTQPLSVRIDPRVKTPLLGLQQQFTLSLRAYEGMRQSREALEQVRKLRAQLKDLSARVTQGALPATLKALDQKAAALESVAGGGGANATNQQDLTKVNASFGSLLEVLQDADAPPTMQAAAAADEFQRTLAGLLQRWRDIKTKDVPALNEQLRAANLPPLTL
ncbi:MAG: glycoside hydrolase [Acidobacteria bacterium]|nr:MAG: glycoside hydrolase [Acidobacteriota bacterium]